MASVHSAVVGMVLPMTWPKRLLMSGSCHLDRASNVEIGVKCQIFVIVIFFKCSEFYNLGHIQGIIRVH